MKTSIDGLNLIKRSEGFRRYPYLCPAGVPTIGYGSTHYENGKAVKLSDPPISEEKGVELLAGTLTQYESVVTNSVNRKLEQNEFDALVSFCYNIGAGAFAKSTLVKMLNAGAKKEDAANQFMRWTKSGGMVLPGLVARREAEKGLFLS